MEWIQKRATLIVSLVLLFHFLLSVVVSSQESMTYDEKAHIPAAYSYVRYGDMRLNPEHPPLLKDLVGIFLLPLNPEFPLASSEWRDGYNEQWAVGDMFVNCSRPELACNDADTILFFSRLPIIILAVLLGIALFLWTKELGGTLAGVFAVTLYAFDPNIIAHNHYVTTDIGSAAFIFLAFYFFVRFLKNPTGRNVVLAGLFLGLAQLAKFSAVLLFPVFGLFLLLFALTTLRTKDDQTPLFRHIIKTLFTYAWKFTLLIVVCFTTVWMLYALNAAGMPAQKVVEHADLFLSQPNTPARVTHDLIVSMTTSPILLPFAEYFVGIAKVFSRVSAGNVHYFMGTVTVDASPSYFPIIFILKETLPFLTLLLLATGYGLYRMGRAYRQERTLPILFIFARSFQNHIAEYLAVFFILFYSYISITGNLNIGFRHLFPILPFLYLLLGKTLADFYKRHESEPVTHRMITMIISLLFFCVVFIPLLSYPSYLSYFNATVGGHKNGYLYATDSNYDWGQDLKYLRNYIENTNKHCTLIETADPCGIDKIRVDYFGGSNPHYYLGDAFIPWWESRTPEAGWYAISTFFYQESLYKTRVPGSQSYAWLIDKKPLARAGDSFFIYYITEADIASLNQP
ncbi:MAG: glycosyltransferase family 39 protein [Candidatus Moranbacteria bacterium]|nr:glycosyltransferase family 39 protein [Candidatus Moranbacteria bacterium]